ncbi:MULTISPECIES: hypothetical protein [Halolamina]|uniref:DUF7964 domain-containing protein n=1 Tax=Halolamina pelagica TaxID=699431 RepID=A0A1I5QUX9_9EURY|nr:MULTISPECIES: hypothetical protein [Halolamina]NHX35548.1 hypothetical protein [Halolamina sp. R1-12]SFP49897.1 hypothetical protein SAMN05216277_10492 [Halolamina pelagica]
MSVLDSLPDRPITDAELASFNRSDAIEIAVEVDEFDDGVGGVIIATEDWVKGLAHEDAGWRVVATVSLGDGENERYEGMRACESAVREALD